MLPAPWRPTATMVFLGFGMLPQYARLGYPAIVGLALLVPVVVGCDTCVNHKPHPEPVERALALLGVGADNALFVGDSPHDVESGRAAGVMTVGVAWGAFSAAELAGAGADVVIDRVQDLEGVVTRFPADAG